MPEISVEYLAPVCVRVNTDDDKIVSVYAHLEEFNCVLPEQFYTGNEAGLPEYLPADHPVAVKALELAETVQPRVGDVAILWEKSS